MNSAAALWLGGAIVGFLLWWPIGAAILFTVFATAVSQQITGYAASQVRGRDPSIHIGEARSIDNPALDWSRRETLRKIERDHVEVLAITDRLRNARTNEEFDRIMGKQRKLGGY